MAHKNITLEDDPYEYLMKRSKEVIDDREIERLTNAAIEKGHASIKIFLSKKVTSR